MPRCDANLWAPALAGAMSEFDIATDLRVAAFLAQVAHESVELTRLIENLNYSAEGLLKTFPTHFTPPQALSYARDPERIANHAYANRNGNGDEASGDGWLYRGRGPIQITGRANYRTAGAALGVKLELYPASATDPRIGARIAGWFWGSHGLNALADAEDTRTITHRINGGENGLAARQAYYATARAVFG